MIILRLDKLPDEDDGYARFGTWEANVPPLQVALNDKEWKALGRAAQLYVVVSENELTVRSVA